MGFCAGPFVLCNNGCCRQRRWNTNFFPPKFLPQQKCSQNDQRDVGIMLSHRCGGRPPPPPPTPWHSVGRFGPDVGWLSSPVFCWTCAGLGVGLVLGWVLGAGRRLGLGWSWSFSCVFAVLLRCSVLGLGLGFACSMDCPRASSRLTLRGRRYLWCCRPLTSQISCGALCWLLLVHPCDSPEFLRGSKPKKKFVYLKSTSTFGPL